MNHPPARLAEGPVHRHLVALTVPMIGGILATMAFNLVDTYFVGRLGAPELAAMSFTFPVVLLTISLAIGLGAGTSSAVARAIGAGEWRWARRLTTNAMLLATGLVAVLTALGIATIDPLFRLLGAEAALLPLIRDYMVIWYLGLVFLLVPFVAMSAIRATGDSRLPGLVMIGSAILNGVLDPLLIFGLFGLPRLELEGAALATVLARSATLVVAVHVLHARLRLVSFARPTRTRLAESWRRILHVGLPAAGTNVIIPLSTAAVMPLVASYGAAAVAGFGVASRIEAVTLVVLYAMSAIIGPFVGQNLGAGRLDRIRRALDQCAGFSLAWGLVVAALLAAVASPLGQLFSNEAEVVAAARLYLLIVPLSYGAAGIVMVVNAAFNGLGHPLPAVALSAARMVGLYVPLAYAGAAVLGLAGVFAATAVANLVVGALGYVWFVRLCRRFGPGS